MRAYRFPINLFVLLFVLLTADVFAQPDATTSPPLPKAVSPVKEFREMLAMNGSALEATLADRPEEIRARILEKIDEYQALPEAVRENRLQATHLQFLMSPLMRVAPEQRETLLQTVPEDDLPLVRSRLAEWDRLAPEVQRNALDQPAMLKWFFRGKPASGTPDISQINPYLATRSDSRENRQMVSRVSRFLELDLSRQMELLDPRNYQRVSEVKTVFQEIQELPEDGRQRCLDSLVALSEMNPDQRNRFAVNVIYWQSMAPDAQQTWRRIALDVSQIMPPTIKR